MVGPAGSGSASKLPSAKVSARDAASPAAARLVTADVWATGVLVVAAVAGAAAPDQLGIVLAVLAGAAFVVGCVAFLWAYGVAVGRSREDLVTMGALFFCTGDVTPAPVRFRLRIALAVQVVAVVVAASVRPYTVVAFGVLAPMLGLGVMALWSARFGTHPPRTDLAPGS